MKVSKEKFVEVYTVELADRFANDPEYAYSASMTTPAALAEKMYNSLKAGTANKDGAAIRATLKKLGIKNTYKAIAEALNESNDLQVKETVTECYGGACTIAEDFQPIKSAPLELPKLPKITLSLKVECSNSDPVILYGPADVSKFLDFLREAPEENFIAIHVNARNEVIGMQEVSRGTLTSSLVHPREVFKAAILNNAHAVFLAHNHPSGSSLKPSIEDIDVTKQLIAGGELLGIRVIDHLIVSPFPGEFYSIREYYPELWSGN